MKPEDYRLRVVEPGQFEPSRHFYPRVLNATIHPIVSYFLRMPEENIIARYCHLNPQVDAEVLRGILRNQPTHFRWGGADLFPVVTAKGEKKVVVIETNSCPSGQKSMPLISEHYDQGGYRRLIEYTFAPYLQKHRFKTGGLAVLFDKNHMECSGYAAALADFFQEPVYLVPCFQNSHAKFSRFREGVLEVQDDEGSWLPIRGALRYVTQRPWNRIPHHTKTFFLNPIICCLAGGRNKMIASMAYDLYNAELGNTGLEITVPETIRDVVQQEVPLIVRRFGGYAVVKVPYSNAGQGVFCITNERELDEFMHTKFDYDLFIAQSLIGNYGWSSIGKSGRLYQVGTLPNKKHELFVADVRMMIHSTPEGFRPIAVYARRSKEPLQAKLTEEHCVRDMLVTNLSIKLGLDQWDSDQDRLILMDGKDFTRLGLGIDDLITGFIQTVLAMTAIDRMASQLITQKGRFRSKLFRSLNDDDALNEEILIPAEY